MDRAIKDETEHEQDVRRVNLLLALAMFAEEQRGIVESLKASAESAQSARHKTSQ